MDILHARSTGMTAELSARIYFHPPDVKPHPFEIAAVHRRHGLITQSLFWGIW